MISTERPLADQASIREAIKLLRETVLEDRKQIILRVVFVLAVVAFTFKELPTEFRNAPSGLGRLLAASLVCLLISTAVYFDHYHRAIDVLGDLAARLAYSDLNRRDLEPPVTYWEMRRRRWSLASAFFYGGCALYTIVLCMALTRSP